MNMTVTLPENKVRRSALIGEGNRSTYSNSHSSNSNELVSPPQPGVQNADAFNKNSKPETRAANRPTKNKALPPSGMSDSSSTHREKTGASNINKETQQFAKDASDGSMSKLRPPITDVRGASSFAGSSDQKDIPEGSKKGAMDQEQALFVQKLCDDSMGVAIRKINQYGKSSLRYVKCVRVEDLTDICLSGNRSDTSGSRGRRWSMGNSTGKATASSYSLTSQLEPGTKVLVWGKKKDIQMPLDRIVAIRKGKTTDKARRSTCPANRIFSIITDDPVHPSLDIEAPSQTDRDKCAQAFSLFLSLPLEALEESRRENQLDNSDFVKDGLPDDGPKKLTRDHSGYPPLPPSTASAHGKGESSHHSSSHRSSEMHESSSNLHSSSAKIVSLVPVNTDGTKNIESADGSVVSSLTGHGFDQELVEELHNALNELRSELQESRAEAARAVKVAEQAIQSAEKNNSQEWQNTVTHRAAEAAAMAQKRSAEAMAKQRLAEERLESERRSAQFWKKQAELAEQEAGKLHTRAAAAEVQRMAIEERFESETRVVMSQLEAISQRYKNYDQHQKDSLEGAVARNRALELELEMLRRELGDRGHDEANEKPSGKRKMAFGRKKKAEEKLPLSSAAAVDPDAYSRQMSNQPSAEQLRNLQAQSELFRRQFELLRKTTADELAQLSKDSLPWAEQVMKVVEIQKNEVSRLVDKLAVESAARRKLLHEVQDFRGSVRVYCRPRAPSNGEGLLSFPSQDTVTVEKDSSPLCFEYDRVFDTSTSQQDIYEEMEEVCLSALDGFNVCTICYGSTGSGKTHTILGDAVVRDGELTIENHGLQFRSMKQFFDISSERSDRYKDTFTLSIIEVHNERLCDLLVGTPAGDNRGKIITAENSASKTNQKAIRDDQEDANSSGRQVKLEIRTDVHGETVVQGAVSLRVESFVDFCSICSCCVKARVKKLMELGTNVAEHESSSHIIATIHVHSINIATGLGSRGKLQFVDLAGSDLISTSSNAGDDNPISTNSRYLSKGLRFAHRSIETLSEVVDARIHFARSVPYRNSTLTHLLLDSLESDTKVQLIACVSNNEEDSEETIATLRFASEMRKVIIGKPTKHTISAA